MKDKIYYFGILFLIALSTACSTGITDRQSSLELSDNSFVFDNHLMNQGELLKYQVFNKYVAVSGKIVDTYESTSEKMFIDLVEPVDGITSVVVELEIPEHKMPFGIGDQIRILGAVIEVGAQDAKSVSSKEKYGIFSLCMVKIATMEFLYHKDLTRTCQSWEQGRPDDISRLAGRLQTN